MLFSHADISNLQGQPTTFDEPFNMQDSPRNELDKKLYVQFYKRAVMNATKSDAEGRPIFDERDFVRILVPGSKDVLDVRADQQYINRFPTQWQKYQNQQQQAVSGTPLEAWPALSVGMVAELKALNVYTVEQLAALSDSAGQKMQAFHMLKQRAQAFLDAAAGDSKNSQLAAELQRRDEEIDILKKQMADLMAKLNEPAKKSAKE